ncbi:MAG: UDP-N-acetylmuramoyl-L-alanine--D-glutamate ligase [Acidiferrobacterales bacterium]
MMQTDSNTTKQGSRALVIGMGQTGASCIPFLLARGYSVTALDSRLNPPCSKQIRNDFPQVKTVVGIFDKETISKADMIVVSPGVSLKEPTLVDALSQGKDIVGDIELFAREVKAPVIAITGSNGKSTVTTLVGMMCRANNMKVEVGGNIGIPVLSLLDQKDTEIFILELSSFQLETTHSLNALVATVLNISPDHMDRYDNEDEYIRAKARIFQGNGAMVLNRDDKLVSEMVIRDRQTFWYGLKEPDSHMMFGVTKFMGERWVTRGQKRLFRVSEIAIAGEHNIANSLAALAIATIAGVPTEISREVIGSFHGLPHRMEVVAESGDVTWINDSKGTNVGSTVAALSGLDRPVILIAGGDGKGADFSSLGIAIDKYAKAVVLIGKDADLIKGSINSRVPVFKVSDIKHAVKKSASLSLAGDAVLLSPACASFDMYRNFEQRGDIFREAVIKFLNIRKEGFQ